MKYQTISEWHEPRKILDGIEEPVNTMSSRDHGFLCGVIKEFRPKKIVEIGILKGATTGVILNAAQILGGGGCDIIFNRFERKCDY